MKLLFRSIVFFVFFFNCESVSAQLPNGIKWQKCLGGSKDDIAKDVLVNSDGTIVVAGHSQSNDGDVTGHHGGLTTTDAWIAKLDTYGNLLWQKSIGGTGNDYFNTVIATKDGAYLCVGYSESTDGDITNNGGYNFGGQDCFIVKISKDGDIIWKNCYGGSLNDLAADAVETFDGGYAVVGTATSYDGYVQSKKYATTDTDGWVFKLDATGNILWEKSLDYLSDTLNDVGYNVIEDGNKNIVAYVQATVYTYQPHPSGDGEFYKITNTPGIVYVLDKLTGDVSRADDRGGDYGFSMCTNGTNYYVAYNDIQYGPQWQTCRDTYYSIVTFFPVDFGGITGKDIYNSYSDCLYPQNKFVNFSTTHGITPAAGSGYIAVGDYQSYPDVNNYAYITASKNYFGGNGEDHFTSTVPLPNGREFITVGYTNSTDGDVAGNHGGFDCWVVWVTDQNKIVGRVFIDKNGNGIRDAGETDFNNAVIKTTKDLVNQYAVPLNGRYENITGTGSYTTTIEINKAYYTSTNTGKTTVFNSYGLTDTIDFPVVPIAGKKDYAVSIAAIDFPGPGQTQEYILTYSNKGTDTLINKLVYFIKDSRSQFGYAEPGIASISGDTLKWTIANMLPETSGSIRFYIKLDPIPSLTINDTLSSSAYIDSTGDIAPANNLATLRQLLRGSFDPNDITEIHGSYITPLEMMQEQYLTYTIRFQNLGNEAAQNIIIRDTLNDKLDPESFEMIASSHPCKLTLQYGKNAVWNFENIHLADSITNDSLSRGYISYRIKPKPGFVTGDTIPNRASIYFDFNTPVPTNTYLTIFTAVPSVWTGIANNAWENPLNWANGKIPDAGSDVYINAGSVVYPEINSIAYCRTIKVNPGAALKINTGSLTVVSSYLHLP
ncbi:MAG: hypothetical protein QM791_13410 [Ferruginibacter sp.]